MSQYFFWGLIILLAVNLIYYIVFFSLIFYWHDRKTSFVVVPIIFTFEFFLVTFLVFVAVELILNYFTEISTLFLTLF